MISNSEAYSSRVVSHFGWENYAFPYKLPSVTIQQDILKTRPLISTKVITNSNGNKVTRNEQFGFFLE